ncbi:hypothetical protein HSBAA_07600 [Vreelandella sulfidaeris]|uniref:Uncharacterized protein n=1 Tax=Vreelandella sulfidaeris TaxID=115553 RepID=A0A455U7E2_9GAMM|nr:hypothetical protein HSBAA_07600 [Halomonas sulfidaeris]
MGTTLAQQGQGAIILISIRLVFNKQLKAEPMNPNYLDFEQPIAELQAKIEELRLVSSDSQVNLSDEISRLEEKKPQADGIDLQGFDSLAGFSAITASPASLYAGLS